LNAAREKKFNAISERWNDLTRKIIEMIEGDDLLLDLDKEIIGYTIIEAICRRHLYHQKLMTTGTSAENHVLWMRSLLKKRDENKNLNE
jgi:hypothetical protein